MRRAARSAVERGERVGRSPSCLKPGVPASTSAPRDPIADLLLSGLSQSLGGAPVEAVVVVGGSGI